jgi:hypothetical protein
MQRKKLLAVEAWANDFRSHSSSEFYKNEISVRSSQKLLLLLLLHSPCLSGALCPSLCCLLLSSRLSFICVKLQWVSRVICEESLSLSLSLYIYISLCLYLSPGRVDDLYVLSPGPALSTHEFERIYFFRVHASYSNWRRQQLPVFNCVVRSPARELPSLCYRKSVLCLLSRNKQNQAMRCSCRDESWILLHWSKLCRRLCSSRSSITVDAAFVPSVPESYFWKLVAAAAAAMEEA